MKQQRIARSSGDKHLTETELKAFFAVIKSPRDKAMFLVMYWRGLRASEPGMLQLSSYKRDEGRLHIDRLKRSLSSTPLLSPAERTALNRHIKIRGNAPGPLFQSNRGTGISRQMVFELVKQYAIAAGLPKHKWHPHTLKHSIATHLVNRRVEVLQIKEWLGHRSINSTLEYTHLADKQRDDLATRLYQEW